MLSNSPYATTQIVALDVGPEPTRFLVHDSVLSRSKVLAAKSFPVAFVQQPVLLPELDQNTAHTLIHYLYTGKFQSLSILASSDKIIPELYKLGTSVYCAAARYKLPGLAELAQNKMKSLDEEMSIFDILSVARDVAFPLLPEDDVWYPSYVEDSLNNAMADDPEPFRKPDFITSVGSDSKLLQLVWKTVMNNYARAPATPAANNEETSTPTAELVPGLQESIGGENIASAVMPPKTDEADESSVTAISVPAPGDDITQAPVVEDIIVPKPTKDAVLKTEDAQPTEEKPATLEPFTDELDFKSSKTYQQMGNKKPEQVKAGAISSGETKAPVHVRSDSVVQVDQPLVTPIDGEMKAEGSTNGKDEAEQVLADQEEPKPLSKKEKKKRNKAKTVKAGAVE